MPCSMCAQSGQHNVRQVTYFCIEATQASISKGAVPPTSAGTAAGGTYSKSASTLPFTSGMRPMPVLCKRGARLELTALSVGGYEPARPGLPSSRGPGVRGYE